MLNFVNSSFIGSNRFVKISFQTKRLFSDTLSENLADTNSSFSFNFDILTDGDIFRLVNSKDSASVAAVARLQNLCALENFNRRFDVNEVMSTQELNKLLGSTLEGQQYANSYRVAYSFYMSTYQSFLGLDLDHTEIQRIQHQIATSNEMRKSILKEQAALSIKHEQERLALYQPIIKYCVEKSPLLAMTFVSTKHLTTKHAIELRRIINEDKRKQRESEMIIELKNRIIRLAKTGLLTQKIVSDLFI